MSTEPGAAQGRNQRRHERHAVKLAVRYTNASQFVTDYVENLSLGGLFIAGAKLELFQHTIVTIDLPGQGRWMVAGKAVFVLDEAAAAQMGRRPGVGIEITRRQPGFQDALLGYLLRLGRRRDHEVLVGDIPGASYFAEAGFRVVALPQAAPRALAAIVGPTATAPASVAHVFRVSGFDDLPDVLARLDAML